MPARGAQLHFDTSTAQKQETETFHFEEHFLMFGVLLWTRGAFQLTELTLFSLLLPC
jgi:hypothetical protein